MKFYTEEDLFWAFLVGAIAGAMLVIFLRG